VSALLAGKRALVTGAASGIGKACCDENPLVSALLAGKRALVTGAASGIGKACAEVLAEQGASVAALDLREDALTGVRDEIAARGDRVVAFGCDVSEEDSVAAATSRAAGELGGLDIVVAAAGLTKPAITHEQPLAQWHQVLGVNLTGVFLTLKHTIPYLISEGGGAIVTIGSIASLVAAGRSASYDASKGGVLMLTRSVAGEYAEQDIRANCVLPGAIATPLVQTSQELYGWGEGDSPALARVQPPMARRADPREVATVVAFLCSDQSPFLTGAAIPVDGGYTAV
jgi:NAD(P)-dependent dehydrogenase (short-subunit alcohol dehydrogenase family)